ncbi:MAG: helix-turn-helix domain-containing protein [Spirochaetales bacterium]|jgi:excisionase family DNA binding protein|nr:helix-turn-helix domain-containing protein [Spirochaetales bacterium]
MKLLTVAEIADEMSVSPKLIYRLTKQNEIPHIRIASTIRFDPAAISEWLRAQSVEKITTA